jgi:hypothetical protein
MSQKHSHGPDVNPPAIRPWAAGTNLPEGAIHIDTYADYDRLLKKWVSGKLDDTLVVIGSAGIGKSEMAHGGRSARPRTATSRVRRRGSACTSSC